MTFVFLEKCLNLFIEEVSNFFHYRYSVYFFFWVLTQINKNCEAKVPQPGAFTAADDALLGAAHGLLAKVRAEYDEQQFHKALEAQWEVVGAANRYVDEQAPWALKKTDPARMAIVLRHLHTALRAYATLLQCFLPASMAALLDQLGVPEDARGLDSLAAPLPEGTALPPPAPLFRKMDQAPR